MFSIRSVLSVGFMTLISRVLGFVREMLIAHWFGTSAVADAWFVAQRLPNLFRRLFAEGAFNSAFVPMFAGGWSRADRRRRAPSRSGCWPACWCSCCC